MCFFKVSLNWGISLNTSRGSYLDFFPLSRLVFLRADTSSRCQHSWRPSPYSSHTLGVIRATGSGFVPNIHVVQIRSEKCDCFLGLELKSKRRVRDRIWFSFPSSLIGVGSSEKTCVFVETFKCVCGDNWSPLAPVGVHWCEPLVAVWFAAERCVLFYHSQALQWKEGGVWQCC